MSTDAVAARPRAAVCRDLDELDIEAGVRMLESAGWDVVRLTADDPETIAREAADADALALGYARVDAALLARLPRLRVIATASMGVDMIDMDAATRQGVWVANVLGAATEEVATHALALALAACRGVVSYSRSVRDGAWDLEAAPMQRRLSERTLGLVGLGRIGTALAERAAPTFGRIVGYDPLLPEHVATPGVERMGFDDVVAAADVLSLHLPLTPESAGLVDEAVLASMPDGAVLVNVSRGGLVDRAALLRALDEGWLAAAALDVLDVEPPPAGDALVAHPAVIVTPHAGFRSDAAMADYVRLQAENLLAWQEHGRPATPVNDPAALAA